MANLEGSSHAEDSVVCFLWWKTFDGQKNDLGLLGDQIIGPEIGQHHAERRVREPTVQLTTLSCPYLKPSDLYPAALLYHLEIGINQVLSHGRLMTKLTREGCDIVEGGVGGCRCRFNSMASSIASSRNAWLGNVANENYTGRHWTMKTMQNQPGD